MEAYDRSQLGDEYLDNEAASQGYFQGPPPLKPKPLKPKVFLCKFCSNVKS